MNRHSNTDSNHHYHPRSSSRHQNQWAPDIPPRNDNLLQNTSRRAPPMRRVQRRRYSPPPPPQDANAYAYRYHGNHTYHRGQTNPHSHNHTHKSYTNHPNEVRFVYNSRARMNRYYQRNNERFNMDHTNHPFDHSNRQYHRPHHSRHAQRNNRFKDNFHGRNNNKQHQHVRRNNEWSGKGPRHSNNSNNNNNHNRRNHPSNTDLDRRQNNHTRQRQCSYPNRAHNRRRYIRVSPPSSPIATVEMESSPPLSVPNDDHKSDDIDQNENDIDSDDIDTGFEMINSSAIPFESFLLQFLRDEDVLNNDFERFAIANDNIESILKTADTANRLPTRTVSNSEVIAQKKCLICYELYTEEDSVKTLPCIHYFHTQCIDPWLVSHDTCPECRHCIINNDLST